jgi:hypothetical protein
MLFTFAGSTHTKYTNYLLDTVCTLELESTPTLYEAILASTVVNLSGKPGSFMAADLMQEHFNRLLQTIVQKKGAEYGDKYIRETISRNLHHLARVKLDLRRGIELERRAGHHSAPHQNRELLLLLCEYRADRLHHWYISGRISKTDRDDFSRGYSKLEAILQRRHQSGLGQMGEPDAMEPEGERGEGVDANFASTGPGFEHPDLGFSELHDGQMMDMPDFSSDHGGLRIVDGELDGSGNEGIYLQLVGPDGDFIDSLLFSSS